MEKITLIKLGGSVITDKSREFTARKKTILQLAKEIKEVFKKTKCKIIVGHGGGSFPHAPAAKYGTKSGIINSNSVYGASVVENAAKQLNMIVNEEFVKIGLPIFSFSPASFLISDTQVCSKSYLDPLKKALEIGMIPMIYGDVVMDKNLGVTIFSTEKLLSVLAKDLVKKYLVEIIYCTNVNGVYDAEGKTIPQITNKNFKQVKSAILGSGGIDVTGGMLHKVEEALLLSKKYGIKTRIVNGNIKGNLKKSLLGKKVTGTLVG